MAPRADPVSIGGAVDIGSNSVHLLVAITGPGWVEPLRDTSELLGLGDTVDCHGFIPAEERARLIDVLRKYVQTARRSHAQRVTLMGTEPLRRASNADLLVAEIAEATGLHLRILTEREEATLTYIGVTRGQRPDAPVIVVDIGGGSTEIAVFVPGQSLQIESVPVGSARLTNAIVTHDPPTEDELDRLRQAAADATERLTLPAAARGGRAKVRALFVGGTATNVARLGHLTGEDLAEDRRTLSRLTRSAVSERFKVKPRRAGQLAAGVAIVEAVLDRFGLAGAEASEASLRDGAIIAAARHGDDWAARLDELVTP
ncbi:MAG: hypothetical protein ACR2H0_00785 [Candidatus Limnocylindrales bacterium]